MARTVDEFGGLDILVNNAFRMDRGSRSSRPTLDYWRKVYEVNVWGALGLTQACVPHLRVAATERRRRVDRVHPLDVDAEDPAQRGRVLHVEGGLRTAVQALALELGPAGVRVNASRRAGSADRTSTCSSSGSPRTVPSNPAVVREEIEARIPLGVIPPQDEIAHSVVFFASPWSKVVTGQTLDVNGGEWFG